MAHQDMIVDQDPFFIIDPSTRRITNQSKSETNVIQYDHNSQRFTFSLPRYVDGHDMSKCGVIEVHYANIDAATKEEITGVYLVDDVKIDDTDDTIVTLTWLLSQNVTQRVGKLDFLIKFMCYSADGLEYAWNTAICSGIAVGKGMNNDGTIETDYPDIITSLASDVTSLEKRVSSLEENNTETTTYTSYGVSIDLSNSNPETAVTYTDDAVGMVGGSPAWYKMSIFNKIKPCLFKNGVVVGYLNPNNFARFEDGTAADITTGDAGDVMIEIPKIGYKISKIGTLLTVQITDEPNKNGFSYKAHTRKVEGDRDKLYVGAFLGSKVSSKLRSLSGKTPHSNEALSTMGEYASSNGLGYDVLSFYPLTLLQCLYLIMYKNLNSQSALGMGYVGGTGVKNTGATIDKGMDYGTTDNTEQIKVLGIEDFWGNLNQFIYGCYIDDNSNLLVATESFNFNGTGYTDMGKISAKSSGGYMTEPQGNNDAGFMVYSIGGSASTYFTDYAILGKNLIPVFGGCYVHGDAAGIFRLNMIAPTNLGVYFGARLMFL